MIPNACLPTTSMSNVVILAEIPVATTPELAAATLTPSQNQAGDDDFVQLLKRARVKRYTLNDIDTLFRQLYVDLSATPGFSDIEPTRMHSRRTNVDLINETKFANNNNC